MTHAENAQAMREHRNQGLKLFGAVAMCITIVILAFAALAVVAEQANKFLTNFFS